MPSSEVDAVIGYKIQNILDLSTLEAISSKKHVPFSVAQTTADLASISRKGALIVCDLSNLSNDQVQTVSKLARELGAQTFGYYPHVSREIRASAQEIGIDYIVPRSAFRAKLETLLG